MDEVESRDSDPPRSPCSDLGDHEARFQPNPKLEGKLGKLAQWRIDPSLITLSDDGPNFIGGHATVSAAFLARQPGDQTSTGGPEGIVGGDEEEQVDNNSRPCANDQGEGEEIVNELKIVAVKQLRIADNTNMEYALGLALREAEFLLDFTHPNIIKLEGFVEDLSNDRIWLIFPWLENGNLKGFLASKSWELPEYVSLINDILNGLEYIHCQTPPICHGDLKSHNILINSSYHAVITDFGSARRFTTTNRLRAPVDRAVGPPMVDAAKGLDSNAIQATFCAANNTITLTNNNYTLRWAAPELLLDDEVSPWSDIWALGWIIYEVLTGDIPFPDVNQDAVVAERVIHGNLPLIAEDDRTSRIGALCFLMNECWKTIPDERPTAGGCRDLINWMPSSVPSPREASEFEAPRDSYALLLTRLGMLHIQQDNWSEGLKALSEALKVFTNNGNAVGRAVALQGIAAVRRAYGEYKAATSCLAEMLHIYTNIGDDRAKADTLCKLASLYLTWNGSQDVTSVYFKALQLYTTLNDAGGRAKVLNILASVYNSQGKYREAISHYTEALEIYTTLGNPEGMATILNGLARAHIDQMHYDKATMRYSEALQIYTSIRSLEGKAHALNGLGEVSWLQEMYDKAISYYSEALNTFISLGKDLGRAVTLSRLGDVYRHQKNYEEAISHYSDALNIYSIVDNSEGRGDTLYYLAEVYLDQGRKDEATLHYSDALDLYLSFRPSKKRGQVLARLGAAYREQEKYDDAIFSYSEALKTYNEIGNPRERAEAFYGLGEVYRDQEKHENAFSHYSEALEVYEAIGNPTGRADTLQSLGMIRYKQGDLGRAIPFLEQAATIFGQVEDRTGEEAVCLDEIVYIRRLIRGSYLNGSHLRFGERTVSGLDEKTFSMDVKPARKKGQKSPNFFKRLILRVVVDSHKSKTEKDSEAKSRVSAPVASKETLEKDVVQSAIALPPETLKNADKADSLPPAPPPSPISLQVVTPSTPNSSPRSVTSTISCSSTSTACETPEDGPDDEDYSDTILETGDDKAKISFLRKQNGDLSCKLDSALSEIVQLKMKLNRLMGRASHAGGLESNTADITVHAEASTPKSVRFADPLEEYEPDALRNAPEAIEALCLAHAQISDLEAEKQATDEEMETLFVELHIVEKQLHKWEEGVTARLKALEDELDDQKSEITYLHNKLREARGQSLILAQDALGRSHSLSKRDIAATTSRRDRDVNVQDSDSDWDDTSSVDSNETIRLSKMSPYGWPPLLDEQFPTPPPLTGCLEKAKNILQATLGQKYVPITNDADDLPAALIQSNPTSSRTQPDSPSTNKEVVQEDHSKEGTVGLSLQLPLAKEVGPFGLPDVSKPMREGASKSESAPMILVRPPSPLMSSNGMPPPAVPAESSASDNVEIVVGRKLSITTGRASVITLS